VPARRPSYSTGEQITLELHAAPCVPLGSQSVHTITIVDNDPLPFLSFSTSAQTGEEGSVLSIGVQIHAESDFPVSVPLIFSGSATAGSDYTVGVTTLMIPPGQRSASTTVAITDDATQEGAELLVVQLGAPSGATPSTRPGDPLTQVITILKDEAPYVSFVQAYRSIVESSTTVEATVTLSMLPAFDVTIPFSVSGTAGATDRTVTPSGLSLVIPAGQTSGVISIGVLGDSDLESNETVELKLGTPSNALLGEVGSFTLEIQDNTPRVQFASASQTVWEDAGTASFTVELTSPSTHTVTVPLKLKTPTGTVSLDPVVFSPGETSVARSINIPNDTKNESTDEVRIVTLGVPVNARLSTLPPTHTVYVKDDDPFVGFANSKGTFTTNVQIDEDEGAGAALTFQLSAVSNKTVQVPFTIMRSSTAKAGTDYNLASTVATITPGAQSVSIPLGLVDDSLVEGREKIYFKLGTPLNAKLFVPEYRPSSLFFPVKSTFAADEVSAYIIDNDEAVLSFSSDNDSRKENSKKVATVHLALSKPATFDVTAYLTIKGTATRNQDFRVEGTYVNDISSTHIPHTDKITIPAGATTASFQLRMKDDSKLEGTESIVIALEGVGGEAELITPGKNGVNLKRIIKIEDNEKPPTAGGSAGTLQLPPSLGTVPLKNQPQSSSKNKVYPGAIVGVGEQGALDGATVFFDANFDGVQGFLDLNNDGLQDENEPDEPSVPTALDGYFVIDLAEEFDLDASGEIEPDEGRFVLVGGTDSSTGIPWTTRLAAVPGHFAVTPLTTLVESLVRLQGLTLEAAETRVTEAFGLSGVGLATFDPLQGVAEGNANAALAYLAHVEMYNTVIQLASLFVGASPYLPMDTVAEAIYADLSQRIAAPDSALNLTLPSVVGDIIRGVAARSGASVPEATVEGAAAIIAAGNLAVRSLVDTNSETLVVDPDLAESVVRAKKVMQGQAATALGQVGAGTLSIEDAVAGFTGAALEAKIAASSAEIVLPPVIVVTDVEVQEGDVGAQIVTFTVELIGDHDQPASVEYETSDGTATEADGDYVPTSGVLSWAASDNTARTVQVTVPADTTFEPDEFFSLLLANSINSVIRVEQAFGIVTNDDAATFLTDASPASGSNAIVLDRDLVESTLFENDVELFGGVLQEALTATLQGAANVDDSLTIDFTGDTFVADALSFYGGGGTAVDSATISGGSFSTITHTLNNNTDGQTLLNGAASSEVHTTFDWFELELIAILVDSVDALVIELPAGAYGAILEDVDPLDETQPGVMRLWSPTGQFAATTFVNPTSSLTIHGSGVVVESLDPEFAGDLTIVHGPSTVVGRHLFYNQSGTAAPLRYDGNNAAINANDDLAIATDKNAYLPGSGSATFANLSSYSKGINGIMIDIQGAHGTITASDFIFRVGNNNTPNSWVVGPAPNSISVRAGAGVSGSDRITLTWANGAISKKWLEVVVLANANTGLAQKAGYPAGQGDVFFFGSAPGDTGAGNTATQANVSVTDELGARNNPASLFSNVPITNLYDFNRDAQVNATDALVARNNPTSIGNVTRFITVANPPAAPEAAAASDDGVVASALTATLQGVMPGTPGVFQSVDSVPKDDVPIVRSKPNPHDRLVSEVARVRRALPALEDVWNIELDDDVLESLLAARKRSA